MTNNGAAAMKTENKAETTVYPGEYKSAIARAKRILVKAGIPWSVTTGRYAPFNNGQRTSYGVRVWRVGCSKAVALHVMGDGHPTRGTPRWEATKEMENKALTLLREAGMPFDERGWLECAY